MRRKHNEDAVGYEYPAEAERLQQYGALFVVADGVGGLSAGDRASQLAVERLIKHFYALAPDTPQDERLAQAVQQVNTDIYQQLDQQAATTLVAIVIHDAELVAASVGDSAIFLIRDDNIEQLNEEDTLANPQTEQEKSVLTKAIGYRQKLDVQIISGTLQPQDRVLLCSDGLTRYVDQDLLKRFASYRDPRDGVRRMINEANAKGGADNISAALVLIGEEIASEDLSVHLDKMSAYVSIADEPMMTPAVATKPNTVVPQAAKEVLADMPLSVPEKPPVPATPTQKPPAAPTIPHPTPPQGSSGTGRNPMLLLGIVALVIGAFLIGGALFATGDDEASSPIVAPTTDDTTSDPAQADSDAATSPDDEAEDTSAPQNEALQINTVVQLREAVVTRVNVGDGEEDVAAFVTVPTTQYIIQDIFQDDEGQLWYRLLDEDNNQSGWLPESTWPAYEIITAGS